MAPVIIARGEEGFNNFAHDWEVSRAAQLGNLNFNLM